MGCMDLTFYFSCKVIPLFKISGIVALTQIFCTDICFLMFLVGNLFDISKSSRYKQYSFVMDHFSSTNSFFRRAHYFPNPDKHLRGTSSFCSSSISISIEECMLNAVVEASIQKHISDFYHTV